MRRLLTAILILLMAASASALELVRQKNVATYIVFPLVDSTTPTALQSGATSPDSEIDAWADGSAPDGFTDCTNEATEIGSTGQYYLSLAQAEMNADYIVIQIKASDAITQTILIRTIVGDPLLLATTTSGRLIVTDAAGLVDANAVKVGPTGSGTAQTARDLGASVLLSPGTGTGQVSLSSGAVTVGTNNDKTGYTASTVSDKTGYSLAASQHVIVDSGTVTTLTNAPSDSSGVTTLLSRIVGTLASGTHNPQTGDAYAVVNSGTYGNSALKTLIDNVDNYVDTEVAGIVTTLGVAGAGLTALGDARLANLDATVSSRSTFAAGTDAVLTQTDTDLMLDEFEQALASGQPFTANVLQIDSQTATAAAGVTFPASIGTSTYAGGAVASVTGSVGSISGITFPTNFANLSISASTGLVDITQTAADKVWASASRTLTDKTGFSLSQTFPTNFSSLSINGSGYVTYANAAPPSAATNAAAVWDLATSGHTTSGTFGEAMAAAGSAGDPWTTTLPGSYTSGQAGYILGTNLNATVSSRSTYAGGAVASVTGDVGGRLLGGGSTSFVGPGAWVYNEEGDGIDTMSIKIVTDYLAAMLETDGLVKRWTANALELAPSGSGGGLALTDEVPDPGTAGTVGKALRQVLDNLDTQVSLVGGESGAGAITTTLTIKTSASVPIADVAVWVTTDAVGSNIVAGTLRTDAFGKVTFYLDAGTYYRWCKKSGYTFTNPSTFTVAP